jgi:hypothetical protein
MNRRRGSEEAAPDELGNDPGQVGPDSAGQSGDAEGLSSTEDVANESVLELADSDQALEAATVEGIEDAADHPERPVHTHLDYGHPDAPMRLESDDSQDRLGPDRGLRSQTGDVKDVEDLSTEDVA